MIVVVGLILIVIFALALIGFGEVQFVLAFLSAAALVAGLFWLAMAYRGLAPSFSPSGGGADCPTAPSRPVAGGRRGSLSDSPFAGGRRPYPPSYVPDPDTPQGGDRSPWKDGRRVPGTGQGTDSPRPHTPVGDDRYVGEPIRVQAGRAER